MTTPKKVLKTGRMQINLDAKDIDIINQLILDSSQSATDISKKTGISKQVLGYRIKDLLSSGIGQCSQLVNLGEIGFQLYDVLIKYRTTPDEKKLFNFLQEKELVVSYANCTGDKDLILRIWARDPSEVSRIIEHINKRFGNFIKEKKTLYVKRTKFFSASKDPLKTIRQDAKMDAKDEKILQSLTEDPRITLQEIAKKTRLSSNGVNHRIKNLRKSGLIAGSTLILDHQMIGKTKTSILLKKKTSDEERGKALDNSLSKNPKISDVVTYFGDWDIGIDILTDGKEEARDLLLEIINNFSDVIDNHTMLEILKQRKHNYYPLNGKTDGKKADEKD